MATADGENLETPSGTGTTSGLGTGSSAELGLARWTEVRPTGWHVLLLPVGATEQHGPHLPLHTDTHIAQRLAKHAVTTVLSCDESSNDDPNHGVRLWLAPALPYGSSGEHQDFPGTLSIGAEALRQVLLELGRSASTWADAIIFVNGHGGNTAIGRQVAEQLRYERHTSFWFDCSHPDADAHAGHHETSLLLHTDPDTVAPAPWPHGNDTPLEQLLPTLQRSGVRAVSPSGILGDPSKASSARGEERFASMAMALSEYVHKVASYISRPAEDPAHPPRHPRNAAGQEPAHTPYPGEVSHA